MRHAIIASAVTVLMAGAGTYGWVVGSAPSLIGGTTTSAVEATKLEEVRLFAAADDAPRTPIGHVIAGSPAAEPEITTGSVNPTAKPGQAAKAATARKQTRKPKAVARKQAQPRPDPNSPPPAPAVVTMASPSGATSVAD
jgi:hypothetical protein